MACKDELNYRSLDDFTGIFIRLARSFYCTICNKDIYRASHARRHAFVHTKEKPYACDQCGKRYQRQDHLNIHLKIHAGLIVPKKRRRKKLPGFICTICHKWFRRPCYEEIHMRTHTGEKPFSCDECGRCFAREEGRTLHMKTHTVPTPSRKKRPDGFTCEICNKWFHNFSHQARHMRIHTGERPWQCDRCKKQFNRKESYTKHMAESTCEKRLQRMQTKQHIGFTCEICNKHFRNASNEARHMRLHSGKTKLKCDKCLKAFYRADVYKKHVKANLCENKIKKGLLPKTATKIGFTCEICNRYIPDSSRKLRHMRRHTDVAPFKCETCGKPFFNVMDYRRHVHGMLCETKTKIGEGFRCIICNKMYKDASHRSRHMRLHARLAPFECGICFKTFQSEEAYNKHAKEELCKNGAENGQRRDDDGFTCKICNKHFQDSSNEARHMRLHSGKKPFECENCNETFSRKDVYEKHVNANLCESKIKKGLRTRRKFTCHICHKTFLKLEHRALHMKTHVRARCSIRKSATKNTPVKKTPVGKSPIKTPVKKTPIKKTPIKTPVKNTPIKKTPVKKTPIKKTPIKKAPIKKTPIKKAPVKKTPLKKTPVKTGYNCLDCDLNFSQERHLTKHFATTHCKIELAEQAESGNESDGNIPTNDNHTDNHVDDHVDDNVDDDVDNNTKSEEQVISSANDDKSAQNDDNSVEQEIITTKDDQINETE